MTKYIIPLNDPQQVNRIIQAGSANPYVIAKTFGLAYLRKIIYGKGMDKEGLQNPNNPYPNDLGGDFSNQAFEKSKFFGTLIFAPLTFKAGNYREGSKTINYPELRLEAVLYDIAMSKNIVKTAIQGRKGTIKEYISDGDYQVNIKGVLCHQNQLQYPEEEVSVLVQILKSNQAIEVESFLLNQFLAVNNLVIESYNLPMTKGFMNAQAFEISAISDTPVEIRINKQA